jgi:hypothetical protein
MTATARPLWLVPLVLGPLLGLFILWWWNTPKALAEPLAEPLNLEDVRSVVKALKPIADGSSRINVHFTMWADGAVWITIKTKSGSEIRGIGSNLREVMDDLRRQGAAIAAAADLPGAR